MAHHPWDNPELVALPITAGSTRALEWIRDSVSPLQGQAVSCGSGTCEPVPDTGLSVPFGSMNP
ncbi:hypothetical protein ACLQ2E_16680 [Streptomyces lavendulocolor]